LKAAGITMLVGWWAIPYGLLVTPVYILKNLWDAVRMPSKTPSKDLDLLVRNQILEEGYEGHGYYPRYTVNANL
jgi:hypothetical protein